MNDFCSASVNPTNTSETKPFANQTVVLTKQAHIELIWSSNRWKSLHQRACEHVADLEKQLAHEKAKVRDLTQRLYGKKSERTHQSDQRVTDKQSPSTRPRGQQPGTKGHGRTQRPNLPVIEEVLDLAEQEKYCQDCGKPHPELPGTDDSGICEITVQAYTRRIKRKKYARCRCQGQQGMITAAPAPRVLNRSPLGISVWVEILLDKFSSAQATHRLCRRLGDLGYLLSQGTITDGLKRLGPLFEPLIKAMLDKHLSERLFHADETGWKVFETLDDKIGYRWYLWLIQSPSVAYYIMAPGRNAGVPTDHFQGLDDSGTQVFLICDRYSAYKKLVKDFPVILLAFCWAHVRRDFPDAARSWPELKDWMFKWVEAIGELYHLNRLRLTHWDEEQSLDQQTIEFHLYQHRLVEKLSAMKEECETLLQEKALHGMQKPVLTSLKNHWPGLTLFADHPQIAMDNNLAERGMRNPVTGRKRFYGSGRVWSAELAAMMFTLLQTLLLWDINPRHWLTLYLTACAENGGKAVPDLAPFLPWEMTADRRQKLTLPFIAETGDQSLFEDSG